MAAHPDAGAIPGPAPTWHRAAVLEPAQRGKARRNVRLRGLRLAPVRVGDQVRERHRLAELLPAAGERGRYVVGPLPDRATYRGALPPLWGASRPRVRRWPA